MSKRYHRDGTTVFCYSHADPLTGEGVNEVTLTIHTNGLIDAETFAEKVRALLNGTPLCCDAPMEESNATKQQMSGGRVPLGIWLQLHCEDELGATWTEKQVYSEDVEYVHADEIRRALMGHRRSELWGDTGLIAATMRCVEAIGQIEDLVTTGHETKEAFIQRVRGVLGHVQVVAPPPQDSDSK